MTLGEIYNDTLTALGKDVFGGYIDPDQFNLALVAVNIDLMNKYVRVFEATKNIADDIYPFVKTFGDSESSPLPVDEYGYMELPQDFGREVRAHVSDYTAVSCGKSVKNNRMVVIMNNADFNGRIAQNGVMLKPNAKRPIATVQNNKLYIQPQGFKNCTFTYIRQPIRSFFDYDLVNNEIIYLPPNEVHTTNVPLPIGTPSLSVELEWPEDVHREFVNLLVRYFSINQRAEFPLQTLDTNKP